MIMPNAHMPRPYRKQAIEGNVKLGLTSKSKGELKERHGRTAAGAEAGSHNIDIRTATAKLCIDDDEADGPVRHST